MLNPCPKGPVVASIPFVCKYSGCPGVKLLYCLNSFKSSTVIPNPNKCKSEYNIADPCPADKINLSLFIQSLCFGEKCIMSLNNVNVIGLAPKGSPGWPEFAF